MLFSVPLLVLAGWLSTRDARGWRPRLAVTLGVAAVVAAVVAWLAYPESWLLERIAYRLVSTGRIGASGSEASLPLDLLGQTPARQLAAETLQRSTLLIAENLHFFVGYFVRPAVVPWLLLGAWGLTRLPMRWRVVGLGLALLPLLETSVKAAKPEYLLTGCAVLAWSAGHGLLTLWETQCRAARPAAVVLGLILASTSITSFAMVGSYGDPKETVSAAKQAEGPLGELAHALAPRMGPTDLLLVDLPNPPATALCGLPGEIRSTVPGPTPVLDSADHAHVWWMAPCLAAGGDPGPSWRQVARSNGWVLLLRSEQGATP